MRMTREKITIALLLVGSILLVSCKTVTLRSNPRNAEVYDMEKGAQVATTPYEVKNLMMSSKSFELRKNGYQPRTVTLDRSTPDVYEVTLDKAIEIRSSPSNAEVFRPGSSSVLGTTPYEAILSGRPRTFELRKDGYISKTVEVSPSRTEPLEVTLEQDVPGKKLKQLTVTAEGLQVGSTSVFSREDVIEQSPNVTAVRRLTDLAGPRWITSMCLTPDDDDFVLSILDEESGEDGQAPEYYSNLWLIDAQGGGGMQRLTDGKYFDRHPAFTPEAEYLYFSSNRAEDTAIVRLAYQGRGGIGLITSAATHDTYPQISPDGSTLLYTAQMPGSQLPQLWSKPVGGSTPTQIRPGYNSEWSPDGNTVLYTVTDEDTGKTQIWTMSPKGDSPTQLTDSTEYSNIHPTWTPDGEQIVFASNRSRANDRQNFDIWLMNADGSDPTQLTTNGSRDDLPKMADDGKTIYFRSNRGLKWDVWVMELANGNG